MTKKQLLDIASRGLETLAGYYDQAGNPTEHSGDILAQFVVQELSDNHEGTASDMYQLDRAYELIEQAINDLENIQAALEAEQARRNRARRRAHQERLAL